MTTATSTPVAGGAPAGLEDFYGQSLEWSECEAAFECATLTVPIDYANPSGQTIQLAISKVPAKGKAKGSLVVNPGGPGASGYDYGAAADMIVTPTIRESYDVIGFDPRGVGRSAPITCVSDAEMDTMLGVDPTPDDKAEETSVQDEVGKFAQACKDKAGPLLAHVSTVEVAKDACRGKRVLLVDDVLATGGTASATAQLLQRAGAEVAGLEFLLEVAFLQGRALLADHEISVVAQA